MDDKALNEILAEHKAWLADSSEGKRADLRGADLRGADLQRANLREANLREANLREADLWEANLQRADLWGADLRGANLQGANLQGAFLQRADLREADLRGANLRGADLRDTCVLTFQFQQHEAVCTGDRLIIGCEDHKLDEWASIYKVMGERHEYTEEQIKAYGVFIQLCLTIIKTKE